MTPADRTAEVLASLPPVARGGVDEAGLYVRMLDEIDYGVALVGASGQLRYANQLGQRALGSMATLCLAEGLVQTVLDDEQPLLRHALIEASRGLRRLLTLGPAGRRASIAIVPVHVAADGTAEEGLAMLMFGKQPASETLTLDFFARTHRLTTAEASVLHGLCAGERPKEIAKKVGVAISTVRTQIGSIRIKTQTGSIRELVNRVAALPPITPAMKSAVCH
ncbi:MAG: helix-turn-helix transcriptional regulator [Proteobacteria bacterium]|nr:helix-turn-helix transcriptional regulator [Pseudomonadota bacterium]